MHAQSGIENDRESNLENNTVAADPDKADKFVTLHPSLAKYQKFFDRLQQEARTYKQRCKAQLSDLERTKLYSTGEIPEKTFTRVLSSGDLHGDLELLLKLFEETGNLIAIDYETGQLDWIGGATAVVINGDMVDRHREGSITNAKNEGTGEFRGEEYLMFLFMNEVDLHAQKDGGKLFKLIGNHEMNNFLKRFTNVSSLGITSFGTPAGRHDAFLKGGMIHEQMIACGLYAILRIGPLLFVHAGVNRKVVNQVLGLLAHIEKKKLKLPFRYDGRSFIAFTNSLLKQMLKVNPVSWNRLFDPFYTLLFLGSTSLLWTREYSSPDQLPSCPDLLSAFLAMGYPLDYANRMLCSVGHTINISRCYMEWKKKIPCENALFAPQTIVLEDSDRTVFGGPMVKQSGPHGISFGCISRVTEQPQLCLMDTGQSRAFDTPALMQHDFAEVRKPSLVEFWFGGERKKKNKLNIFILKSKHATSRC